MNTAYADNFRPPCSWILTFVRMTGEAKPPIQ
jgi:hypothetical protein